MYMINHEASQEPVSAMFHVESELLRFYITHTYVKIVKEHKLKITPVIHLTHQFTIIEILNITIVSLLR